MIYRNLLQSISFNGKGNVNPQEKEENSQTNNQGIKQENKKESGVFAVLGLGIGFMLGHIFKCGWDIEMFVFIFIGGAIGGILGTNSVGSSMMQAITAEQNIVNEELLTEILNKLSEEE